MPLLFIASKEEESGPLTIDRMLRKQDNKKANLSKNHLKMREGICRG